MDLRRALLVFAIVLLVAATAGSLVSPRPAGERDGSSSAARPAPPPDASDDPTGEGPAELELTVPARPRKQPPPRRALGAGERTVLTVSAREPGQVTLEGLGRVDFAQPDTPATFDLLVDRPGSYKVVFAPVGGIEREVGTLVVDRDRG